MQISNPKLATTTFGAGCFWSVEKLFSNLQGVKETAVGYMGGDFENPTYENVCSSITGHAEVVEIKYDPAEISYDALLDIFWKNHNPTTLNRQGPDTGSQYRSVIFYYSPAQKLTAEKSLQDVQNSPRYRDKKIVTQIMPAKTLWRAEEYHQKYLAKQGLGSCHV